jgi:putative peptidoglycan lipid II flippase
VASSRSNLSLSFFNFSYLFTSNIFKKILGFFRELILAFIFGSSIIYANYLLLKTITDFLSQFTFGNALQANLLPKFSRLFNKHKELDLKVVNHFSKNTAFLIFIISFIIQLLVVFFLIKKSYFLFVTISLILSFILSTNFYNSIFLTILQAKGEFRKFSIATSLNVFIATFFVYPLSFLFSVIGTVISRLFGVISLTYLYIKPMLYENKGYEVNVSKKDFNLSILSLGNISLFILLFSRFITGFNGSNDITYFNYSFVLLNVILTAFIFNINTILLKDISSNKSKKPFFISIILSSLIAGALYFIVMNYSVEIVEFIYKRGAFSTDDVTATAFFFRELSIYYIILMFTTIFFQPFFSLGIEKNSDFAKKIISVILFVFICLVIYLISEKITNIDACFLFLKVMSILSLILSVVSYLFFLKNEI